MSCHRNFFYTYKCIVFVQYIQSQPCEHHVYSKQRPKRIIACKTFPSNHLWISISRYTHLSAPGRRWFLSPTSHSPGEQAQISNTQNPKKTDPNLLSKSAPGPAPNAPASRRRRCTPSMTPAPPNAAGGLFAANLTGALLAVASSAFIGVSFIVKKKGLRRAAAAGARAGERSLSVFSGRKAPPPPLPLVRCSQHNHNHGLPVEFFVAFYFQPFVVVYVTHNWKFSLVHDQFVVLFFSLRRTFVNLRW